MQVTQETANDCRFLEIEHKFLVACDFDWNPFIEYLRSQAPEKEYQTEVTDTYYLVERVDSVVFRHRCDSLLQQLTLKSLAGDNESRVEVNLDLDLNKGVQSEAVLRFLQPLGILWTGALHKSVQVFYFEDVEIVFYRARYGHQIQSCIEVEARNPKTLESAKATLTSWEQKLGLKKDDRCSQSLLELLVFPTLPKSILVRFGHLN